MKPKTFDQWILSKPNPVPDGEYLARLRRSRRLPAINADSPYRYWVNLEAVVIRSFTSDAYPSCNRVAYGRLDTQRYHQFASKLTEFLRTFELYKPHMSRSQRLQAALEFIAKEPIVIVRTTWVGWSHRGRRAVLRSMRAFPAKHDGTFDPVVVRDGERIIARAYISEYRQFQITEKERLPNGGDTTIDLGAGNHSDSHVRDTTIDLRQTTPGQKATKRTTQNLQHSPLVPSTFGLLTYRDGAVKNCRSTSSGPASILGPRRGDVRTNQPLRRRSVQISI